MAYIQYQKGDIFDSKAHVIVNTVNCEGVMGKGLALAFKQKYPAMFKVYQQDCKKGELRIGRPTLYRASKPWILNFPTKDHWRLPSKLEYLEKGLEYLVANYKKAGIKSIAFPKLGAQNGKLSWNDVGPLMARYLSQLNIDVYIYIAEDDTEYQYDSDFEGKLWKQFNEIALSADYLYQEVGLSLKEAKKVAYKRASIEFQTFADFESLNGLAKVSLKRIKDYFNRHRYTALELSGLPSTIRPRQQGARNAATSPMRKRKKSNATADISMESLFTEKELVSNR